MAEALLCPLTVALSSVLTLSWLERHGAARPERSLESVAVIMRGDHVERELWDELSDELAHMSAEHAVSPHLIFLTATETARGYASRERSVLARELPGLLTSERQLPASIRTDALLHIVRTLNADPTVQAISIHLPLPSAVDAPRVFAALCAEKDAQGLGALNYRELCLKLGRPIAVPPIAAAVLEALRRGTVALEGRRAVVLGRSSTVGGPIAQLLMRSNATVTVVTSFTPAADVPAIVRSADVLVATTNVPNSVRGARARAAQRSRAPLPAPLPVAGDATARALASPALARSAHCARSLLRSHPAEQAHG